MVRRSRDATFMGGAHVFPGGGVDRLDMQPVVSRVVQWSGDPEELPWRAAALRELYEEAGLLVGEASAELPASDLYTRLDSAGDRLDADALRYWSNWITPRPLPRRYDTRFYLVEVAADADANPDQAEVFDAEWVTPSAALDAADRGDWSVEFPTRAHLEMLAACDSVEAALELVPAEAPPAIEPRLRFDSEGVVSILLPGDPGFEEAE
jgi:8-oxo-dGTP pyrophosphatase MutT (NUDIX family)